MCNASILRELDLKICATVPSSECEALGWTNFWFNNVLKLFSSWKDFIHELLTVCLFWKHYVTEKREEKFKGETWFLWLNLFLFQNALRHVKCVRRNPRNHLYKKLSNERSLKLKKRIVFLSGLQGCESHFSSTSHTSGYAVLTILPQKQETNSI